MRLAGRVAEVNIIFNDPILIKKSKAGDEKAFEELMRRNQVPIYRHIYSMVKDEGIAEDLTQEAFIAAYQHLHEFQGRSRFSTWLWRIGHNKALSYLRKQKEPTPLPFKEECYQAPSNEEEEAIVEELLAHLSPKHAETYRLFVVEHLPQKEIAKRLGIPHGTVRSRIHYARSKLKNLRSKEGDKR